ncbi:hypothetical protein CDV36_016511, partial [Fusarium kuroshium]
DVDLARDEEISDSLIFSRNPDSFSRRLTLHSQEKPSAHTCAKAEGIRLRFQPFEDLDV